jgi:hypothetical protein
MKKTFHVDEGLLRKAREASGTSTDSDTIRLALEALIRHAAYRRLRTFRGSERRRSSSRARSGSDHRKMRVRKAV